LAPASSHLYVVQNHLGLVKVGRATNVQARFRCIARDDICKITPVAIKQLEGWREPFVHRVLAQHNAIGEWYAGTVEARSAIVHAIPFEHEISWPVPLDRRLARSRHR
jgi:hypothetical protein